MKTIFFAAIMTALVFLGTPPIVGKTATVRSIPTVSAIGPGSYMVSGLTVGTRLDLYDEDLNFIEGKVATGPSERDDVYMHPRPRYRLMVVYPDGRLYWFILYST